MEILNNTGLRRILGPESVDDLNPKPSGVLHIKPINKEPKIYKKTVLSDIYDYSQRNDEKINNRRMFNYIKNQNTSEYIIENVINRKKLIQSLDERRNFMPIIAPGDKLYRNVDYSPDFYKEGGLVVGSTNSARYNKTVGKKANNFYDTLDLSVPTLDSKKLWMNKLNEEDQKFNKQYVNSLLSWEENYLGITKKTKAEKLIMQKTANRNIKNASPIKKNK